MKRIPFSWTALEGGARIDQFEKGCGACVRCFSWTAQHILKTENEISWAKEGMRSKNERSNHFAEDGVVVCSDRIDASTESHRVEVMRATQNILPLV